MAASPPTLAPPSEVGTPVPSLPDWFPGWAKELAELYFSGTTSVFLLHGNVHDLVRVRHDAGDAWCNLSEFLATQLFGAWDVVLHYDLGRGLRPLAGSDPARLQGMVQQLAGRLGDAGTWPREPDPVLALIDRYLDRSLVDDSDARKRIALLFAYAQYLVPAGDLSSLVRGDAARLVRFLSWAQNPYIKRANVAFCLIAEKLTEVNDRLVQSPHAATIHVPLPDRAERLRFISARRAAGDRAAGPAERLADMTSGLSLVNLNVLLATSKAGGEAGEAKRFGQLKKALIERQCQGLVEFVEPKHTLDLVVGHSAACQRLVQDAQWIGQGRLDAAPMGYLITGPVGTGKTFLAECYAGAIGIPCVKLRNFRSKYVGETEGNLEQVLTVLRSLGPVVVIIDEADAALGSRQAEGDSGTSSRVFSMIASQMGDTSYRGKIVWMLLTSRPDLLPIDLKRQGRAEVHIPLFYPQDDAEVTAMFQAMARKNQIGLAADALTGLTSPQDAHLSGADIESVMLAARRIGLTAGRDEVQQADLRQALGEFIPSAQGMEKEMQEIAAVLECTQQSFLTPAWREKTAQSGGRARLQERLVAIRQLLEE
ncbi:MAG TPA: ATP-binding protein [Pirellulales bacterium]|nr:ATP-binding protein [Pirellulales bacterium]